MKKILLSISLLLAFACQKEGGEQSAVDTTNQQDLTVKVFSSTQSRVSVTPDDSNDVWSVKWEDGDALGAWYIASASDIIPKFTMTKIEEGSGGKVAYFTGDSKPFMSYDRDVRFIYPYVASRSCGLTYKIDVTSQSLDMNDSYNTMAESNLHLISDPVTIYAAADINENPAMHHVTALGEVVINPSNINNAYMVEKIVINGLKATGEFDFMRDALVPAADKSQIEILVANGEFLTNGQEIRVPFSMIPYTTVAGDEITFDLYFTDGGRSSSISVTKDQLAAGIEFKATEHAEFILDVDGDDIKLKTPDDPFEATSLVVPTPEPLKAGNNKLVVALSSKATSISGELKDNLSVSVESSEGASVSVGIDDAQLSEDGMSITLTLNNDIYSDDKVTVNYTGDDNGVLDAYDRTFVGTKEGVGLEYYSVSPVFNEETSGFEGAINAEKKVPSPWYANYSNLAVGVLLMNANETPAEVAADGIGNQVLKFNANASSETADCKLIVDNQNASGVAGNYVAKIRTYVTEGSKMSDLYVFLSNADPYMWLSPRVDQANLDSVPTGKWVTIYHPLNIPINFNNLKVIFRVLGGSATGITYFDRIDIELDTRRAKVASWELYQ